MRVLIVGKAKTGTTALTSLIRQALVPSDLSMEPRSAFELLPFCEGGSEHQVVKILWEHYRNRWRHLDAIVHGELGFDIDRVVFISRDVRDEMISKLLYHAKIAKDDGLIPGGDPAVVAAWVEVLRRKEQDPGGTSFFRLCREFEALYEIPDLWARITNLLEKQHFERYIHDGVGRDSLTISYDDLVAGRVGALEEYLGMPLSRDVASVDLGEWSHTKRSATTDNWRRFFVDEDVDILRPLVSQMLPDPRYHDWDLEDVRTLPSHDYSEYVTKIGTPG